MKKTKNINLSLYDLTDTFDITGNSNSLNHNMEIIDDKINNLNNKYDIDKLKETISSLLNSSKTNQFNVYCWGDSLTQGEGSNIKLADKTFTSFNLYPYTSELTKFSYINLGCQGENVITIMARQGSDPMLVGDFVIPKECTPVIVGNITDGISTKSGNVARPLCPNEAGINPCKIYGIEGILHRGSSSNDSDKNYYFTRLEEGTSIQVPSNTEIITFAMSKYRNGVAVIWMGANGGYNGVSDFISKVKIMLSYGNYDNYLIIVCREFKGNDLNTIINAFTDKDGISHVLNLYKELPIHGLTLANMVHYYFDTSSYANGDEILLKAPILCSCVKENGVPKFENLHFSAYGYKAIGKLVSSKLTDLLYNSNQDDSDSSFFETDIDDAHGHIVWRLTQPYTSNGYDFIDTKWAPYDEDKNWTIVMKFSDSITNNDNPGSLFESRDDAAETSLYFRRNINGDETYYDINMGKSFGFPFKKVGGFFEWVGGDFSNDGYHYLVLSKNDESYWIGFDGGVWNGYGAQSSGTPSNMTLLLFARKMSDGIISQFTIGEISDFRIYDSNFSDTECKNIMKELKGI